ncbi:MAG: glycosyltransferase family 2 protein [Kineosporiaceae bacterium]|nr:glycosyltransferase family 2 protein [Kineosporiaceae bacterium]MBK7622849.1 glycosyltransferase family 2 protein [Kineosporiaceae bacterium]MBK8078118.1 glycosyltransferase family 2 protein [Kineosporiaceae bacterium]
MAKTPARPEPGATPGEVPSPRQAGDDAPAVSVIIPTVDREKLLLRAVRSVAGQDHLGPIEIIVVRDGTPSADATAELEATMAAELRAGVTLRQIPNTRSKGLPGARNSGILAASNAFVAFCDDDDEWLPDKLSAQVPLLVRTPSASMVATGVSVVTHGIATHRPGPLRPTTLEDLLTRRIMELHPSTFLIRRDDLTGAIGLVDEDLPGGYAEDYDLLLRAAAVGPVLSVPRPLVRVHWHGSSYYFSKWQMIHDSLDVLLDKHPQFASIPRGEARIRGQQAIALAAMGRRREALSTAFDTVRLHRGEPRAYVAAVVASGVLSVEGIQRFLHRRGRGL